MNRALIPARVVPFTRAVAAATVLFASTAALAAEPAQLTDEQKTLYAIGATVSRSLQVFDLTPEEFEIVKKGLVDAQTGANKGFDQSQWTAKIQELARSRRKATGERQAGAGKAFLEKAAKEKGAALTPSGMVYIPIVEGKGTSPTPSDVVKVNYRGTLVDGSEFDSSYTRGRPIEFRLDNVIKCWTEGVQMMKPGGKAKLICPPQLAYGENGVGDKILPGATLAFEVELLEVKPATSPATGAEKK